MVVGFGPCGAGRFLDEAEVRAAVFFTGFVLAADADFLRVVVAMSAFHATDGQPTVDGCGDPSVPPKKPTRSSRRSAATMHALTREIHACRTCPRLVEWREQVAVEKRAAFRDDEYWGKAISGFGDPSARIVILGWHRLRTERTEPAGCSPATAAATGCSGRCTRPGSPIRPNRPAPTTVSS